MTYKFRVCFTMPVEGSLTGDQEFIEFAVLNGQEILKFSAGYVGNSFAKSKRFSLSGGTFRTVDEAQSRANAARLALLMWSVRNHRGIDLGQDSLKGFAISEYGKQLIAKQFEAEAVIEDHLGITVYPENPQPRFIGLNIEGRVSRPAQLFADDISKLYGRYKLQTEKVDLAAGIYAKSHFRDNISRFLLLFITLETLIAPVSLSMSTREHVDRLAELTNAAELDASEKQSLLSRLGWLKQESIAQAGQKLAQQFLDGKTYGTLSPAEFFRLLYKTRNEIVHRGKFDPKIVSNLLGEMDQFVSDILMNYFIEV